MADRILAAQSAFSELKPVKSAAFSVERREDLSMASITAGKGKVAEVRAAMQSAYALDLPDTARRVEGNGICVIWHGPDQWIAMAERGAHGRDLERELMPLLAGLAAVVDQTDGRAVIRVSGSRVRDVLAKGVPLDLHPRAFECDGVAITHASHIGIILWQTDAAPMYEIAMFRSFADSFAGWLMHSAAEFAGH